MDEKGSSPYADLISWLHDPPPACMESILRQRRPIHHAWRTIGWTEFPSCGNAMRPEGGSRGGGTSSSSSVWGNGIERNGYDAGSSTLMLELWIVSLLVRLAWLFLVFFGWIKAFIVGTANNVGKRQIPRFWTGHELRRGMSGLVWVFMNILVLSRRRFGYALSRRAGLPHVCL